jgi:hypothetical protein
MKTIALPSQVISNFFEERVADEQPVFLKMLDPVTALIAKVSRYSLDNPLSESPRINMSMFVQRSAALTMLANSERPVVVTLSRQDAFVLTIEKVPSSDIETTGSTRAVSAHSGSAFIARAQVSQDIKNMFLQATVRVGTEIGMTLTVEPDSNRGSVEIPHLETENVVLTCDAKIPFPTNTLITDGKVFQVTVGHYVLRPKSSDGFNVDTLTEAFKLCFCLRG